MPQACSALPCVPVPGGGVGGWVLPGDYWAIDDESGLKHPASEMARDWDGSWRHKDNLDGRHPQLDVKARRDPVALTEVRPKATSEYCEFTPPTIGQSNIFRQRSPVTNFAGIGSESARGAVITTSANAYSVCGPLVVYPNNFA